MILVNNVLLQLWESSLPPYTHPGFGFVTYQHAGGATYPVSYVDKATGYLPVAGTMAVINNVEKGGVSEVPVSSQAVAGPQDFRTRFKIVKVETTIPLKVMMLDKRNCSRSSSLCRE